MTAAVVWWSVAPLVLLAALDLVRPVLVARYALVSLPLVALGFGVVVARAAAGRGGVVLRTAGVATLAAAVATSAWQASRPWKYEDYRGAAAYAARTVAAGTPVLFAPSSARLGIDAYLPRGRLADIALPGGVGADPLAITQAGPTALRAALAGVCSVVVIGDPVTAGVVTGPDATTLVTIAGWTPEVSRGFGEVTVTVLADPACAPRRIQNAPRRRNGASSPRPTTAGDQKVTSRKASTIPTAPAV